MRNCKESLKRTAGVIVTGAFLLGMLGIVRQSVAQESVLAASSSEQHADQVIRARLRQPLSVKYQGQPLSEVARELARSLSINVHLDRHVLSDAGIDPDALSITADMHGVSAGSAISKMLSGYGLTWDIDEEALVITTKEQADAQVKVRVYLVRDLVATNPIDVQADDADALIDVITGTVATHTWSELGGPGTLEYFCNSGGLVVSQTREVHDELENLLAGLRKARGLQGIRPAVEPAMLPAPVDLGQFSSTKRTYWLRHSWNRPQVHR